MQRISSRSTFFTKRVFPVIWFGFLVFFVAVTLVNKPARGLPVVFDLADEVLDAGDALIVRFGSEQERIPLSEIINVSYVYMTNPPRVTLTLRTLCQFGKEVSFSPPTRFLPFAKSPIVADLIERADAARRA
jgi:hypothetical protein